MTPNQAQALKTMLDCQAIILHALSDMLMLDPRSAIAQADLAMQLKSFQGRAMAVAQALGEEQRR
jgi:hypothetical protein